MLFGCWQFPARWCLRCPQQYGNPEVITPPSVRASKSRADILTEARQRCSVHRTAFSNCKSLFSHLGPPGLTFKTRTVFRDFLFQQKISSFVPSDALLLPQRCKKKSDFGSHLTFNFLHLPDRFFWSPLRSPYGPWLCKGDPTVLTRHPVQICSSFAAALTTTLSACSVWAVSLPGE